MLEVSKIKSFFVFLFISLGAIFFMPNILSQKALDHLPSFFPRKKIVLGLDLQGGSHLLMEVDMESLMKEKYEGVYRQLRAFLRQKGISYRKIQKKEKSILLELDQFVRAQLEEVFHKKFPELDLTYGKGQEVFLSYRSSFLEQIRSEALERSIEVIRRRVDGSGTSEPIILSEGDRRIVIQLPGVEDPKEVSRLLGTTAKLGFYLVEKVLSAQEASRATAEPGKKVLPSDEDEGVFYLVSSTPLLTGEYLERAQAIFSESREDGPISQSRPVVAIGFDRLGARLFGDITKEHFRKPLAIVLDDRVLSAPHISAHITDGHGVISSGAEDFTIEKAGQLALLMRSGALPAPLTVLEEKVVGPSLGRDSIHRGTQSVIFSFIGISLFAILFYSAFGLFAIIALFFNLVLMLGGLSALGATLTLPGIGGIAIALGMAVDANILINERIKEELRVGRKLARALSSGYEKAKSAILDSNITTLIGAAILYYFGTGSVRGFAVTLSLGVLVSMFTSTLLCFVLSSYWFSLKKPKAFWM